MHGQKLPRGPTMGAGGSSSPELMATALAAKNQPTKSTGRKSGVLQTHQQGETKTKVAGDAVGQPMATTARS